MPAKSQSNVGSGTPSQALSATSPVISGASTQQSSSSQQGKSPAGGSAAKTTPSAPPSSPTNNNNGSGGGGSVRKEKKAGIVFPIGRIRRYLKEAKPKLANRIGDTAAVMLAAVLEYLVAEVTELAGTVAKEDGRKRITPRHLMLAIREDDELDKLLQNVILPQSGVWPHVHNQLLHPYYFTAGVKGKQMRAKTGGGKKRKAGDEEGEEGEEDEQQPPKKKVAAASKKNKADDKQQQGEDEASGDEEGSDEE